MNKSKHIPNPKWDNDDLAEVVQIAVDIQKIEKAKRRERARLARLAKKEAA